MDNLSSEKPYLDRAAQLEFQAEELEAKGDVFSGAQTRLDAARYCSEVGILDRAAENYHHAFSGFKMAQDLLSSQEPEFDFNLAWSGSGSDPMHEVGRRLIETHRELISCHMLGGDHQEALRQIWEMKAVQLPSSLETARRKIARSTFRRLPIGKDKAKAGALALLR